MNNGVAVSSIFLGTIAGCCAGYFLGKKITEKKMNDICNKAIEDVKAEYKQRYEDKLAGKNNIIKPHPILNNDLNKNEEPIVILDTNKNNSTITNYTDYSKISLEAKAKKPIDKPITVLTCDVVEPQVVTDNDEDWSIIDLTLYSDNVLTDDCDEPLSDDEIIEALGSLDVLNKIGEYEEGALYVRNNARECYYEVFLDLRKYTDVVGKGT